MLTSYETYRDTFWLPHLSVAVFTHRISLLSVLVLYMNVLGRGISTPIGN